MARDDAPEEPVEVEIKGLLLDPNSNTPIVLLKPVEGSQILPIWIGIFEAHAIALTIEGLETPRPLTHELFGNTLTSLGTSISKVVISDLRDNTFYAVIYLDNGPEEELTIDARPSDAIALALRSRAPIFVSGAVLARARAIDLAVDEEPDEEQLKEWLEKISPDDLPKYTM